MNQALRADQAASMNALMNASMSSHPAYNEDLTPVAHNKPDKSNSHQQEDDMNTRTDQSQPAENIPCGASESGPKTLKTLHFRSFYDVRKPGFPS
jgi:hypothetical protein